MKLNILKLSMIVVALSGMMSGCGDQTTSAEHYASGTSHQKNGDSNAAIIEFKNALKKDPGNYQARLSLGLIYHEQGDLAAAKKELERAVDKEKTKQQALVPYAAVLNNLGQATEVLELPLLTSNLSEEQLAHAQYIRGRAFLQLNQDTQGREALAKCRDNKSNPDFVLLCQATIAFLDDKNDESRVLVEQLLEQNKQISEALLLSGAIYTKQHEYAKAVKVYQRYIDENKMFNSMVNLLLAEAYVNNDQPEQATKELDVLLKANPVHPTVNFLKSRILFAQENFELAFLHANNTVKRVPGHYLANLMGGISAFRIGDYKQSFRMLNRIAPRLDGQTVPVIMNVINHLKLGNVDGAKRQLAKAGEIDEKTIRLFMLAANEFRTAQDFDTALAILRSIEAVTPNSPFVLFELGSLKIQMGDSSGVEQLERTLMTEEYSDRTMPLLLSTYFKLGRQSELDAIAAKLKEKLPNSPNGWAMSGKIAVSKEYYATAQSEFEHILDVDQFNVSALIYLTKLHARKEDFKTALDTIDRALAIEPKNVKLLTIKTGVVFSSTNDSKAAENVLKSAYDQFPDDNDLIVERALIHGRNKELKQGIMLLASISDKEGLSNRYWNSYGELLIRDNRRGEALAIFNEWGKKITNTPAPLLKQIALAERMGLFEQGLAIIEEGRQRFSHIKEFGLLDVSFSMMAGKLTEAQARLGRLKESDYDPLNYGLIVGELDIAQERYKEGIKRLLPVYQQTKKSRALRSLSQAYIATEQHNNAVVLLEEHLEREPNDSQFKHILAEAYVSTGNKRKAVEQYKTLVNENPGNAFLLNNLAWMLHDAGDHASALVYADKALAINNENAQILDTHGVILLALDKYERAEASLDKALSIEPKSFVFHAHSAQLALARGDKDKAKKLLHAQMAETNDDKKLYDKVAKALYDR